MVVQEHNNWQDFCQWLFDQPEHLHALQAISDMPQFRSHVRALATTQGWHLSELQLDENIRELNLSWIQRCL